MLGRWRLAGLAGLIVVLAALLWGPAVRTKEAVDLAMDVAAGAAQSPLKRAAPAPMRTTIRVTVSGRPLVADLYRPGLGARARAAAVAVPGAVDVGKDDPNLVAFATSLARAGFVVLAPDIPNVRAFRISASDADVIADAVQVLASADGAERARSVGLFAFSYAVGPAILAAMKPETRNLVRFVCGVGGYYSIEAAVTYFTTGYYRYKGKWIRGTPSPYSRWVFLLSNASRIESPQDAGLLLQMANRRLADERADIADLAQRLGPEGRTVYALLTNEDPARVPALIAALPPSIREEMQRLDLANKDFGALRARLILIHGRNDTLVPYTEGLALARAARRRAGLYLIDEFGHVELEFASADDIFKFWQATYDILSERDAMPRPGAIALP